MIATEMAPLAKVGGLADVVPALSAALLRQGHDVRVVLPHYSAIDDARYGVTLVEGTARAAVEAAGATIPVLLVDSDAHFHRDGIYTDPATGHGYGDDADRWIFFQRAALALLKSIGFQPDIIHCHDHQTGFIPAHLRTTHASDPFFAGVATLFTIHNLAHQGVFEPDTLIKAGFDGSLFYPMGPFEYYGKVNMMKAALSYADIITTVSPTYAREICTSEQGNGLEGVLQSRSGDLHGVLNGIDTTYWNPEKDPHLEHKYSAARRAGKARCKKELLEAMGLPAGRSRMAVAGIISRLAEQKGFDLLERALPEIMEMPVKLVVLGSGDLRYQQMLQDAAAAHPDRVAARIGFDEALAHLIEAGSDIFLMPSRFEPCGLNQMYSLAYGTVPVVRATGGLADTVDEQGESPNGFVFGPYDHRPFVDALRRALELYADSKAWTRRMLSGMRGDYSWDRSARAYVELYAAAVRRTAERPAGALHGG